MAMRVTSVMDGSLFSSQQPNLGTRCRGAVHPNELQPTNDGTMESVNCNKTALQPETVLRQPRHVRLKREQAARKPLARVVRGRDV